MTFDAAFWLIAIGNVSRVLLLLTGLLGLVRWRQLPRGLRYLVAVAWFGLLVEGTSELMHGHVSNLVLIPLDASGELWLLSLVYAWALGSARFARWQPWWVGAFVLYAGVSGLTTPEAKFKTGVLVLESLLLLLLAMLYFRKLLNELRVPRLTQDPMFWVSTGLVLYSLGKLLISLFSNYMLEHYSRELNLWVWTIHAVLIAGLYCCYFRALWMRPQK
ncbi:hypothetical protein ACFST9_18375 [Hymenobacter monticola]|uniref:Uncharacterized protein n=1 Tax=Hymenobacter monticola TaxID=1705399 RepID=A0ABY4AZ00_9BACT|nr:hypothetical protein [Hymenobacter monticola]UOE32122.1 hypothetical protein MTP16_13390 [Hymenobacter monticola]